MTLVITVILLLLVLGLGGYYIFLELPGLQAIWSNIWGGGLSFGELIEFFKTIF